MLKIKKVDTRTILIVVAVFLAVVLICSMISKSYKDYSVVKLKKNKETIFTISDLKVNDLKYYDNEKEIIKKIGKPINEKKVEKNALSYKNLYYDGLVLILRENYNDYMLVGAEVTKGKYKTSRGIRVGTNIGKAMKKYRIENEKSTYMYGNYSTDSLTAKEITDNIYFGVRTKDTVVYMNRDAVVDNGFKNLAKLELTYKRGKVTKIAWIYDFN